MWCGLFAMQPRVNAVSSDDASFGWGPAGGHVFQKAYLEFFCSPGRLDRLLAALEAQADGGADGCASITLQVLLLPLLEALALLAIRKSHLEHSHKLRIRLARVACFSVACFMRYPQARFDCEQAFNAKGQRRAHRCQNSFKEIGSGQPGGPTDRHVMCVTWGVFDGSLILQPTVVDSSAFEVWKDEAFQLWTAAWANIYPPDSQSRKVVQEMADNYWHVYMVDNDFVQGDLYQVFRALLNLDLHAGSPVIRPKKVPPG